METTSRDVIDFLLGGEDILLNGDGMVGMEAIAFGLVQACVMGCREAKISKEEVLLT